MKAWPRCSVCGGLMVLGQPGKHWTCQPPCPGCHHPVNDCRCTATTKRKRR